MIQVICPSCKRVYTAPANAAGKRVRCPACREQFIVSGPREAEGICPPVPPPLTKRAETDQPGRKHIGDLFSATPLSGRGLLVLASVALCLLVALSFVGVLMATRGRIGGQEQSSTAGRQTSQPTSPSQGRIPAGDAPERPRAPTVSRPAPPAAPVQGHVRRGPLFPPPPVGPPEPPMGVTPDGRRVSVAEETIELIAQQMRAMDRSKPDYAEQVVQRVFESGLFSVELAELMDRADAEILVQCAAKVLNDPNSPAHRQAVAVLAKLHAYPDQALPVLMRGVEVEPSAGQVDPVGFPKEAIPGFGEAAVPYLVKAMQVGGREQSEIRTAAVETLGEMATNTPEAIPPLVAALEHQDAQVAKKAADALVSAGSSSVAALCTLMDRQDAAMRHEAVTLLARIGPQASSAVPALTGAIHDEDQRVQLAALDALSKIGPQASTAVPALTEAIRDEDQKVRFSAIVALSNIVGIDSQGFQKAFSGVFAELISCDPWTMPRHDHPLLQIGTPALPLLLREFVNGERARNRRMAGRLLQNWGSFLTEKTDQEWALKWGLIPRIMEAASCALLDQDTYISEFGSSLLDDVSSPAMELVQRRQAGRSNGRDPSVQRRRAEEFRRYLAEVQKGAKPAVPNVEMALSQRQEELRRLEKLLQDLKGVLEEPKRSTSGRPSLAALQGQEQARHEFQRALSEAFPDLTPYGSGPASGNGTVAVYRLSDKLISDYGRFGSTAERELDFVRRVKAFYIMEKWLTGLDLSDSSGTRIPVVVDSAQGKGASLSADVGFDIPAVVHPARTSLADEDRRVQEAAVACLSSFCARVVNVKAAIVYSSQQRTTSRAVSQDVFRLWQNLVVQSEEKVRDSIRDVEGAAAGRKTEISRLTNLQSQLRRLSMGIETGKGSQ